jgi:hypothetical protein
MFLPKRLKSNELVADNWFKPCLESATGQSPKAEPAQDVTGASCSFAFIHAVILSVIFPGQGQTLVDFFYATSPLGDGLAVSRHTF